MRFTIKKATAALLATGLFACSSSALATNGYFTHGVGTESKGMGGAGVGSPENMGGISVATNPALGVFADEKWQVGLSIFSPRRSYQTRGGVGGQMGAFTLSTGDYDSDNEAFPIPYVAKNWRMANDNALSFVFYGRGGMNTEWDSGQFVLSDPICPVSQPCPGVFGGGKAGVDLMQAFMSLNYSGKVGDSFAWGLGPVVAVQMFEATGLSNFALYTKTGADAFAALLPDVMGGQLTMQEAQGLAAMQVTALTNNGHDTSTGFGFAGGIWADFGSFSAGLAYQSKMSMDEFDDYSDLYAESGGFDIPSTLKAGISFLPTETTRMNIDIEHIKYTDVDSVSNPIANLTGGCWTANPLDPFDPGTSPPFATFPESSGCLGGPSGAGFGWDDMTVYKVGLSWDADDSNTWRFGYSYGEQPIPSSEVLFNILAPGVMEHHLTIGWTSVRSNGSVMSWSLMYAPTKEISGVSTFDPLQTIDLEMQQLELEFAYRF